MRTTLRVVKCKGCKEPFQKRSMLHTVCSPKCAEAVVLAKRAAAERKETATKRALLKPRSKWLKEAQQAFNAFIRARDNNLSCISCGRRHDGQIHAGHYLSTGARPELRFSELNVWAQCAPCNTHLHGNLVLYRAELIRRIGLEAVEQLEGYQAPREYDIAALKAIRNDYRARTKQLLASRG